MIRDSASLDYLFIHTFWNEELGLGSDFSFIALDFLKHAYSHIEEYSGYVYADDCMDKWSPETGMQYKILNMILAAARHGNQYAREMLCRIYKVYYKREYNQLKRFRTISFDELISFENEDELFQETAARILTICPFMGIEVQSDCEMVIPDIDRILDDKSMEFRFEPVFLSFEEGLFEKASEEARQLIKRLDKKDKDFFWRGDTAKFKRDVFQYFGVPIDFDLICEKEFDRRERSLAVTISILKKRFRNRTFTDEEIVVYHTIYALIRAFTSHIGIFDETVDMMLGRTEKFEFEKEHCRYKPEKQKIATTGMIDSKPEKTEDPPVPGICFSTSEEEKYIQEINELKTALKLKQENLDEARRKYMEMREAARQSRLDEEKWEADREELYKLRQYVYSLTEEDIHPSGVSMDEMKKELENKKIIIVGGHDNWVGYLKEIFPSWTYIKPSVSNTLPETHAVNADYLFFFSDTLSHGAFSRYMNVVRKYRLPYGYLHGTNIDRSVSSIYREVIK